MQPLVKVLATPKWNMDARRISLPPHIQYNGILKRPANVLLPVEYPPNVAQYLIDLGYVELVDTPKVTDPGEAETKSTEPETKRKRTTKPEN